MLILAACVTARALTPTMTIATEKRCSRCFRYRQLSDFSRDVKRSDGVYPQCMECNRARRKSLRVDLRTNIRRDYDISLEQFDAMLELQAGLCAICSQPMQPGKHTHIDHDHATGNVRSLLCGLCNKGLGHFRDDQALCQAAAQYLHAHS